MSDESINRLLGEVKGQLNAMQQQQTEGERKASESREAVFGALRELREDAQKTRHRTEVLEQVMKHEVRPVIKGVLDWRSRAVGGMAVITVVGMAVIGMFTVARDVIFEMWRNSFTR